VYSSAPSATGTVSIFLTERGSGQTAHALDVASHHHAKNHSIDGKTEPDIFVLALPLALEGQETRETDSYTFWI
jgi:hypothetical protein